VDEVLARAVRDVLLVLLLALPVAVVMWAALTARRARSASFASAAARSLLDEGLLLSLLLIGFGALRPGDGLPAGFQQWNLIPFHDLARALDGRPWGVAPAEAEIVANVAAFVPWGLCFALRFGGTRWWRFALLTLAMSTGIEVWQAFNATGRSSDVTDIITNTAGGVLGFAIGRGCRWVATEVGRWATHEVVARPSATRWGAAADSGQPRFR
jgi:hypothetical protein